jgi:hypothetical protein
MRGLFGLVVLAHRVRPFHAQMLEITLQTGAGFVQEFMKDLVR